MTRGALYSIGIVVLLSPIAGKSVDCERLWQPNLPLPIKKQYGIWVPIFHKTGFLYLVTTVRLTTLKTSKLQIAKISGH